MKILNKDLFRILPVGKFDLLPDFKEERTQKFITIILTLIAVSFFALFAINPTLSTIAQLKKQVSDNELVDKQLSQKINNLTILQQKYTALKNDIPIIISAIPKGPEIPLLVAQVQAASINSNVSLNSLQTFQVEVGKPSVSKKFSSFSFALSAGGSYNDLLRFISTISNMQRIVSVDILSFTTKSGSNLLELNFKGKSFFNQ